jgi:hypothetical protein
VPTPSTMFHLPDPRQNVTQDLQQTPCGLDPWLRQLLLSGIAAVHPATPCNLTVLTTPYRDLASNQARLGSHALFYGFFHRDWIRLQDDYLRSQQKPTERNQSRHAL